MSIFRRIIGLFLALCMVTTLVPVSTLAAEDAATESEAQSEAITSIFASQALTSASLTETVSGYCGGEGDGTNLCWTLSADTGKLTVSGEGAMADYSYSTTAPWNTYRSEIKTLEIGDGVTSIGSYAFLSSAIEGDVVIGNDVASIGNGAFLSCYSITSVAIPSSVTAINKSAFQYCTGLKTVTIAEGVGSLGSYAFGSCTALTSITLPASLTSTSLNAFENCDALLSAGPMGGDYNIQFAWTDEIPMNAFSNANKLKTVVIPEGITKIGHAAFYGCTALESAILSEGLQRIEGQAFEDCTSLQEITLPSTCSYIGQLAFAFQRHGTMACNAALRAIHVNKDNPYFSSVDGILFNKDQTTILRYPPAKKVGYYGISYTIPETVTTIGAGAFNSCEKLRSIEIHDGVTTIESGAFGGCQKLRTMTIPDGVQDLSGTFMNCMSLVSVTLPENLEAIGYSCFSGCSSLKSIVIPSNVTAIEDNAFYNCKSLKKISIPAGVTSLGKRAFYNCNQSLCVYFNGDAPTVTEIPHSYSYNSFDSTVKLYYPASAKGWSTSKWNGYYAYPIYGGEAIDSTNAEIETGEYYEKLSTYQFRFSDASTARAVNYVTVTWNGNTFSSGEQTKLDVTLYDANPNDVVTISCAGYRDEERSVQDLRYIQRIQLYPTDYASTPRLQRCIATKDGGLTYGSLTLDFTNLVLTGGDETEETSFETSIFWGSHGAGKLYVSQTLDPADGIEITDYEPVKLSKILVPGKPVYALLVPESGQVYPQKLAIQVADPNAEKQELGYNLDLNLDLGENLEIPTQDDDFLNKFELGWNLLNSTEVKFSVEEDGTIYGLIGVEIDKQQSMRGIVESFADQTRYSAVSDTAESVSNFKDFLKSNEKSKIFKLEPPTINTFVVEAEAQVVGYVKGKWNGGDPYITECSVGLLVGGKVEWVWQMVTPPPASIPFYFSFGLEPKMELTTPLVYQENGNTLFLADALDFKGEIAAKGAAGLGLEGAVSIAAYTKGSFVAEGQFPIDPDTSKVYVGLTVGVEAELFCWDADLEIWVGSHYIYPKESRLMLMSLAEEEEVVWNTQSRDYLNQVNLLALAASNTESGGEVVADSAYTYANVQLAALEDGTQIMVWTADPGTREEANNRTVLYYSIYDGWDWWTPMPVEVDDDGTADFNPILQVVDNQVFLVWQDASRALTAEDTIQTTADAIDLSVAVYDPMKCDFNVLGTVGTAKYDSTPSVAIKDGNLAVVWTSNSGEKLLAPDGNTTALHRAEWDGEVWSFEVLAERLGYVDQTAANGSNVYFSADTDYDSNTVSDKEIFLFDGTLHQLTDNDVADTKPEYMNGSVVWYSGSQIVVDGEAVALMEDTDRYQYLCSDLGMEAVVYVVTEPNTRLSSLYASFNDGTGWGDPIRLDGGNGNIGSFSAQFLEDGTLSVVVRERSVTLPENDDEMPELSIAAQLKVYTVSTLCDLAVERAEYLPHSLAAGETLDLQVDLKNNGMATVRNVRVSVSSGSRTLVYKSYSVELLSGEEETLVIPVPMPATLPDTLKVTITPLDHTDSNSNDNYKTLSVRLADVSMEDAEVFQNVTSTQVVALVANRGYQDLDGVTIALKDEDENILATQTDLALDVGETQFITFDLDLTFDSNTYLSVEAVGLETENIKSNNRVDVLVTTKAKEEVSVSADALKTDTKLSVIVELDDTTQDPDSYLLCCAAYNSQGKMVDVQTLSNTTTGYFQFTFERSVDEIESVRLFSLDSNFNPMLEYKELFFDEM